MPVAAPGPPKDLDAHTGNVPDTVMHEKKLGEGLGGGPGLLPHGSVTWKHSLPHPQTQTCFLPIRGDAVKSSLPQNRDPEANGPGKGCSRSQTSEFVKILKAQREQGGSTAS